jgi:hypothetical protein
VRRSSDRRVSRIIYPTAGAHIIRSATMSMIELVDSAISRLEHSFSRYPNRKAKTTARERCLGPIQYICHLAQVLDIFMSSCRARNWSECCKAPDFCRRLHNRSRRVHIERMLANESSVESDSSFTKQSVITAIYGVLSGIWDRF